MKSRCFFLLHYLIEVYSRRMPQSVQADIRTEAYKCCARLYVGCIMHTGPISPSLRTTATRNFTHIDRQMSICSDTAAATEQICVAAVFRRCLDGTPGGRLFILTEVFLGFHDRFPLNTYVLIGIK
jgi:hypothetical protein